MMIVDLLSFFCVQDDDTKKCQGCSVVVHISKPPTTMVGNPSHFVEKHGDTLW